MSALASASCPICNGTGWQVVERGGLSGAARCSCVSAEKWYRLRKRKRGGGFGHTVADGPFIYCCSSSPIGEVLSAAREQLNAAHVEIAELGTMRPANASTKPFAHRGTLSFYMEKF